MHGFVSGVFLICGGHGCDFFYLKFLAVDGYVWSRKLNLCVLFPFLD